MKNLKIMLLVLITMLSLPIVSFGKTYKKVKFALNQIQVNTTMPLLWNKNSQTVEQLMPFLPLGSKVVRCGDIPILRNLQTRENVDQGKYYATKFLVKLPDNSARKLVKNKLIKGSFIKDVWLNALLDTCSSAPPTMNDPTFNSSQYHMKYDATAIAAGVHYTGVNHAYGYPFRQNSPKIIIAIIDGGGNFAQQDFQGSWLVNTNESINSVDDDMDGYVDNRNGWDWSDGDNDPTDPSGHGTHVSGIVGARNNNTFNMCSVITDTGSLLILRTANAAGTSTDFNNAAAYYYALAKGARIVNMSFGGANAPALVAAIAIGVSNYKTLGVTAVGNSGSQVYLQPASAPSTLTVGNANAGGIRNSSSSYSDSLDIMANGTSVISLAAGSTSGTANMTGSSQAAPFMAGVCWWILKMDSSLTPDQVINIVRSRGENHAFQSQTGWGYFSGLDTLCYQAMRPDTLVTFTACTGKKVLPYSKVFYIVDSARYGLTAISGDSINTNLISPGTYTYFMAWKSIAYGQIYRDTFKLKVTILPGSGAVTPSVVNTQTGGTNPMCSGGVLPTFTASPTNGGITPSYQWYKKPTAGTWNLIPGATNVTYTPANVVNDDSFRVIMTPLIGSGCYTSSNAISNAIGMIVNAAVTPGITIVPPTGTICQGNILSFVANSTNGGTNPSYSWTKNSVAVGSSNPISIGPLNPGDHIEVTMTSNANCLITNTAVDDDYPTITSSVTPSITIAANPSGAVCAGTSIAFTATPTNGGTPSYQWKVNGGNMGPNNPNFSYAPNNGDIVTCTMTSTAACATTTTTTSTGITMATTPTVTPAATMAISTGSNPMCAGSPISFTATAVNGGSSPSYGFEKFNGSQWIVQQSGTNAVYSPSGVTNGDQFRVVLTSSLTCVISQTGASATTTITVNPMLTPAATITANPSSGFICQGTNVIFTATSTNVGGAPNYQWKINGVNAGNNSTVFASSTLSNNDVVTCLVTNTTMSSGCFNAASVTSNAIAMTVTSLVAPTISITANPGSNICSVTPVTFNSSITNGGTSPSYQWKKNNVNDGTNPSYSPSTPIVNGDVIKCELTSNAGCLVVNTATSNDVIMNVTPAVPVPPISMLGNRIFVNAGHTNGFYSVTIPPGIGNYTLDFQQQINNAWVLQFTATNNPTWVHSPINNAIPDSIRAILKPVGGCYAPDSSISNTVVLTSGVGVAASTLPSGFHIYPTPLESNNVLIVEGLNKGDKMFVYNTIGQIVFEYTLNHDQKEAIQLSDMAKGIYVAHFVTLKGETGDAKIIK